MLEQSARLLCLRFCVNRQMCAVLRLRCAELLCSALRPGIFTLQTHIVLYILQYVRREYGNVLVAAAELQPNAAFNSLS